MVAMLKPSLFLVLVAQKVNVRSFAEKLFHSDAMSGAVNICGLQEAHKEPPKKRGVSVKKHVHCQ